MSDERRVGFDLGDGCVVTFAQLTPDEEEMLARTWAKRYESEQRRRRKGVVSGSTDREAA